MKVSYLSSPKWEDEVELTTWHKGREGVFSLRDFEITPAGGGSPLIQATSSWLLIDAGTRRMLRPDHVLGEKSTSTALDRNALAEPCGKLLTPAEGMEPPHQQRQVRRVGLRRPPRRRAVPGRRH